MDFSKRSIYRVLKGIYLACLMSILNVGELTGLVQDRLVPVDRQYVENSEKLNDITGLVTIMLGIVKAAKRKTEIVVSIKRIMDMVHLVPETVGTDNIYFYVKNRIDLEIFNRTY